MTILSPSDHEIFQLSLLCGFMSVENICGNGSANNLKEVRFVYYLDRENIYFNIFFDICIILIILNSCNSRSRNEFSLSYQHLYWYLKCLFCSDFERTMGIYIYHLIILLIVSIINNRNWLHLLAGSN